MLGVASHEAISALRPAARRRGGRVLDESVLLVVRANAFYTYPDALLTVAKPFADDPVDLENRVTALLKP